MKVAGKSWERLGFYVNKRTRRETRSSFGAGRKSAEAEQDPQKGDGRRKEQQSASICQAIVLSIPDTLGNGCRKSWSKSALPNMCWGRGLPSSEKLAKTVKTEKVTTYNLRQ